MQVKHCVTRSEDRHGLKGDGSSMRAVPDKAIGRDSADTTLEAWIPAFKGQWENLARVLEVRPEVVSHNLETVRRLTREVRIQAKSDRSSECLRRIAEAGLRTKSGIMLGF